MKPFVIVTIQDKEKSFLYDIEIPTHVPAGKLVENIKEVLTNYNKKIQFTGPFQGLYCERLKRELSRTETCMEAGIWNGDRLIIG